MTYEIPIRTRLLRSFLSVPYRTFREWRAECEGRSICWVCARRRKLDPVSGQCRRGHFLPSSRRPGREEWRIVRWLKGVAKVGWKGSKEDAASRGGFIGLKEDGETVDFVALTEPDPLEKEGFKKGTVRNVYRVQAVVYPFKTSSNPMSLDLSIFSFNAYAAQVGEGEECRSVVRMTRSGKKGDLDTRYAFEIVRKLTPKQAKTAKAILKEMANIPF